MIMHRLYFYRHGTKSKCIKKHIIYTIVPTDVVLFSENPIYNISQVLHYWKNVNNIIVDAGLGHVTSAMSASNFMRPPRLCLNPKQFSLKMNLNGAT